MRSFIAIELSPLVSSKIDTHVRQLANKVTQGVRWVPARNIHLTVKFLGDIPEEKCKHLANQIERPLAKTPSFSFAVRGWGVYPNKNRPRVIWIGVEAPDTLKNVYSIVETAASEIGIPREERPFSPHLTVGRVLQHASHEDMKHISALLTQFSVGLLGHVEVTHISFFSSVLKPTGAEYTCLYNLKLSE